MNLIPVEFKADLTPVIEAVAACINSPRKGFEKLLHAALGPWMAKREALTAKNKASSKREVKEILHPQSDEEIVADFFQIIQDQKNIRFLLALKEALEQLNATPDEEISDEPLDKTFFNHWQQEAEIIDDDYLRTIWAKLLVEEVKKNNSISRRTLDTVKNLSKEEADLFFDIAFACFRKSNLVTSDNNGITDDNDRVIALRNSGLITETAGIYFYCFNGIYKSDEKEYHAGVFGYGNYVILSQTNDFRFPMIPLTTAGNDLLRIISITPDENTDAKAIQVAKSFYYSKGLTLTDFSKEQKEQVEPKIIRLFRIGSISSDNAEPLWDSTNTDHGSSTTNSSLLTPNSQLTTNN